MSFYQYRHEVPVSRSSTLRMVLCTRTLLAPFIAASTLLILAEKWEATHVRRLRASAEQSLNTHLTLGMHRL